MTAGGGLPALAGRSPARGGGTAHGDGPACADGPRETSGLTTRLIVEYVRARGGQDAVAAVVAAAGEGRSAEELADESSWCSYDEKIALFAAAADVLGEPDAAYAIGASVLRTQVAATTKLVLMALGSTQMVLRSVAKANVKFSTTSTMRALSASNGHATITYRLDEGFQPSEHDCRYTQGVMSQAPVLFGLAPARITHPSCQVLGAPECRYEVRWSPGRGRLRRRRRGELLALEIEAAALRKQLADLQETGAEIVFSTDLDGLLSRIARRASSAVQAQRYLLTVRLDGDAAPRVHGEGFGADEARRTAEVLLAADGGTRPGCLVSDVASAHGWFGRLAAYLPEGEDFLPSEQGLLDAYAGLAAAALANATAIAEANRRRAVSDALVDLARTLSQAERVADAARSVAAAAPAVVAADRAVVMLWDDAERALVPAGMAGFPEDLQDSMRAYRIAPRARQELRGLFHEPRAALHRPEDDPATAAQMRRFGHAAAASAPIMIRGTTHGAVVAYWTAALPPPAMVDEALRSLSSLADQAGLSISNLRMLESVRHQATHDALTGLGNRRLFHEHLASALHRMLRDGRDVSVCFLDLDGFKSVNDNLGHAAGDEVLVAVAKRITSCVRAGDVVARLSGDEFGVMLTGDPDLADATAVADKLVADLSRPFEVGRHQISIGVSVGISLAPDHGTTPEDLLNHADTAMYEAKRTGGTHRLYRAG